MDTSGFLPWLTRRETIVALAIVGGAFSLAASVAGARRIGRVAAWCNAAAYGLMGTSMLLFILAGLR